MESAAAVAVQPTVPRGVYVNESRESAIAFKNTVDGVWYLTFIGGRVSLHHVGVERFRRNFPLVLNGYPIRRAVRLYADSEFPRDEQTDKVLKVLLRTL